MKIPRNVCFEIVLHLPLHRFVRVIVLYKNSQLRDNLFNLVIIRIGADRDDHFYALTIHLVGDTYKKVPIHM